MSLFADPTAHSSFLSTYLVRVLAYTAGMVAVLYLTAGLVKTKTGTKPPLNSGSPRLSSQLEFLKPIWQRFLLRYLAHKPLQNDSNLPQGLKIQPAPTPSNNMHLHTQQTLALDSAHTAHLLDSPDGRWLLVTGPTGTQLHPLKRANHVDLGDSDKHFENLPALKNPVLKHGVAVPDGWGPVSMALNY
jgi:hypothetical protein